jgi:predicted small lipoprotein YifL
MRKTLLTFMLATVIAVGLAACGWKPSVTAVPLTTPWTAMNLPVEKDAVVWGSTPAQFKAVHKAGRQEITAAYILALTKAGWKQTKKDLGSMDYYDFEKGADKIQLNVYDFENTGVIIDKK